MRARRTRQIECRNCRFEYYLNSAAAVAALITDNDGNLLVAVRGKDPAKGTWDLPGGFVDPGESAEAALQREIKEELGLDIVSMSYLCSAPNVYEFAQVRYATVDLAYVCHVHDVQLAKAVDEVDALLVQCPSMIDVDRFGFESIRRIVARFIESTRGRQVTKRSGR
jgi:ADP-ribose pyrophosphatase YjhB (NUDIX family)